MFTIGEAAREVGMSKSTLSRAIKAGKISAVRTVHGAFEIDPAELFRVYPPKAQRAAQRVVTHDATDSEAHDAAAQAAEVEAATLRAEAAGLRAQVEMLREMAEDLRSQRDGWQKQAEASQRLLSDGRPKRGGLLGLFSRG